MEWDTLQFALWQQGQGYEAACAVRPCVCILMWEKRSRVGEVDGLRICFKRFKVIMAKDDMTTQLPQINPLSLAYTS